MAHLNFKEKSITAKVVYYGCGLCGKTANLEYINSHSKDTSDLLAVSTEGDRTIFFDFLPVSLGKIRGIETQFKLYAVPGQVRYNMTRKLVLKDVDGVVFVVDSQKPMLKANLDSLQNLRDNLCEQGVDPDSIPIVLQYNKRDLPNVLPIPELEKKINPNGYTAFASSALTGEGVFETLDQICSLVFDSLQTDLNAPEKSAEDGSTKSTTTEESSATTEEISATQESSVATKEDPAATEEDPEATEEDPEGTEENPAATEENPAATEEDPAATEENPAATEEDPAATEENPAATEEISAGDQSTPANGAPSPLPGVTPDPAHTPAPESLLAVTHKMEQLVDELRQQLTQIDHVPSESPAEHGEQHGHGLSGDPGPAVEELNVQLQTVKEELEREKEHTRELQEQLQRAQQGPPLQVDAQETAALRKELETKSLELREAKTAHRESEMRVIELERNLRHMERSLEQEKQAAQLANKSDSGKSDQVLAQELAALKIELETTQTELGDANRAKEKAQKRSQELAAKLEGTGLARPQTSVDEPPQNGSSPEATGQVPPQTSVDEPPQDVPTPEVKQESPSEQQGPEQRSQVAQSSTVGSQSVDEPPQEDISSSTANESSVDAEDDSFADDPDHKNAHRIARVMVGDLLLYHREELQEGIRNNNVDELLADQIKESRNTYESRVPVAIREQRDYLALELDKLIAKEKQKMAADAAPPSDEIARTSDDAAPLSEDAASPTQDAATPDEDATPPPQDVATPDEDATPPPQDAATPGEDATSPSEDATPPNDDTASPQKPSDQEPAAKAGGERNGDNPFADDPEHKNAHRIARVMVGDLLLYHRDELLEGIANDTVEELLAEPITESKKTFDGRVSEKVRTERDYLTLELNNLIEREKKKLAGPFAAAAPQPKQSGNGEVAQAVDDEGTNEEGQETGGESTGESRDQPEQATVSIAEKANDNTKKASATDDPDGSDPFENDRDHKNARRIARVMVADLLLYHRDELAEGIRNNNVHEHMSEQIAEARKTYESRVSEEVRNERDYLAMEIDKMIEKEAEQADAS